MFPHCSAAVCLLLVTLAMKWSTAERDMTLQCCSTAVLPQDGDSTMTLFLSSSHSVHVLTPSMFEELCRSEGQFHIAIKSCSILSLVKNLSHLYGGFPVLIYHHEIVNKHV